MWSEPEPSNFIIMCSSKHQIDHMAKIDMHGKHRKKNKKTTSKNVDDSVSSPLAIAVASSSFVDILKWFTDLEVFFSSLFMFLSLLIPCENLIDSRNTIFEPIL